MIEIEASDCTRCGACATLCPDVFDVSGDVSRVRRQPNPDEHRLVQAARLVCPTDAIRVRREEEHDPKSPSKIAEGALFPELATCAERVRWNLGAIEWDAIDAKQAPADLRLVVREMAFSEHATYSATQRFLESFFDDVEFSQWISVWFYEETRHPHVLIEWLRRVGEPTSTDFALKGRISTPFMKSIVGTLVTNVISEVTAAQAYKHLANTSPEPILAGIAKRIAGDEARHAASFFRFAERALAKAPHETVWREHARGLEVLQAWLGGAQPTTHPVAQMLERLKSEDAASPSLDMDFAAVRTRVVRVVGLLLDLPLKRDVDVGLVLRDLLVEGRK